MNEHEQAPLTEEEKLAQKELIFNTQGITKEHGKNRKKSHTPKMTKKAKHRRDRAMRKARYATD